MSSFETMTIWHLKDLCSGKKVRIPNTAVRNIGIPQYDNLRVEDIMDWARSKPEVWEALPEAEHEISKLPKQNLANIVYTRAGSPFKRWVDGRMTERNERMMNTKNMNIELDPEINTIFMNSTAVSVVSKVLYCLSYLK